MERVADSLFSLMTVRRNWSIWNSVNCAVRSVSYVLGLKLVYTFLV